ncbi:MAG: DUF6671 family protein [Candidatus Berkiella sp.]
MLQGKEILLATMHDKQLAIAPVMRSHLACEIIVPKDYDTDQFGTFSGEKERFLAPKNMVLHKAKIAMQQYSYDFGIATEGSFGPHPLIPFTPMHEELIGFIDFKNQIEIVVAKQTHQTNYIMCEFTKNQPHEDFLSTCLFPSHALIVREMANDQVIAKGITSLAALEEAINKGFSISDTIRLETDMRAMFNPTRMNVIKELTMALVNRLQAVCAKCHTYGFGEVHYLGRLPCSDCHSETALFLNMVEKCIRCDYQIIKPRHDKLSSASPTYCNFCNP